MAIAKDTREFQAMSVADADGLLMQLARLSAEMKKKAAAAEKRKAEIDIQLAADTAEQQQEYDRLFDRISQYIRPDDFTGDIYRKVAGLLYEQRRTGEIRPAEVLNHFTEDEEHREAAALFNTRIRDLRTKEEEEQALKDTILRVKRHSIDVRTMDLDPADMAGLQEIMAEKRRLEELRTLHISID